MAGGYQPYGQQMSYAPPQPAFLRMRRFGIAYMSVRGLVVGGLMLLILFAASLIPPSALGGEAGLGLGFVVMIFVAWLGYCIAAGVLAMKGNVAGLIMAIVDISLTSALALVSLFTGEFGGAMCWLVPHGALIATAVPAFKERFGQQQPGYPPQYQQQYSQQQYGQPQYPQQQQYAQPSPPVQQQYAPVETKTAVVPSPKMAMLWILALAASVDPDHAQEALVRARNVAAKLLGPTAQARIQRQLAGPVQVLDLEADLWQQVSILVQDGNAANKTNILRGAEYVLKGPGGMEPLGEQFIATLKHQLGI